jgi:hypothetical protein
MGLYGALSAIEVVDEEMEQDLLTTEFDPQKYDSGKTGGAVGDLGTGYELEWGRRKQVSLQKGL